MVPAFSYSAASAALIAIFPMRLRSALSKKGDGAFFYYLLMPSLYRAVPLPEVQDFPVFVRQVFGILCGVGFLDISPHTSCHHQTLFSASIFAVRNSFVKDTALCAMRIPRPPPPDTALMMTGNPILLATLKASFSFFYRSVASGNNWNSRLRHSFSSKGLVSHLSNSFLNGGQ